MIREGKVVQSVVMRRKSNVNVERCVVNLCKGEVAWYVVKGSVVIEKRSGIELRMVTQEWCAAG